MGLAQLAENERTSVLNGHSLSPAKHGKISLLAHQLCVQIKVIDRKAFKLPFRKSANPQWVCPTCSKGVLKIEADSFRFEETRDSKRAHSHEAWDPEWIDYVYSCSLICSNDNCKEMVSSSGEGFVVMDYYYDEQGIPEQEWETYFRPKYFFPHLKLFQYPPDITEQVAKELDASFELFFCSPSSAANHVRISLENLLTALKIKRFNTKAKRRLYLNLHQRIELLPKKHENLQELLLAIKWLGNAGSHSTQSITKDDVMDAYEIMDEVLGVVFPQQKRSARSIAKEINKKKGPRKRKR